MELDKLYNVLGPVKAGAEVERRIDIILKTIPNALGITMPHSRYFNTNNPEDCKILKDQYNYIVQGTAGRSTGIDGILIDNFGQKVAVQIKYKITDSKNEHQDLTSFYEVLTRDKSIGLTKGLLITNIEKDHPGILVFSELIQLLEDYRYLYEPEKLSEKNISPKKIILSVEQEKIVQETIKHFEENDYLKPVCHFLPTGYGKTEIIKEVLNRFLLILLNLAVYVMPTKVLISGTSDRISNFAIQSFTSANDIGHIASTNPDDIIKFLTNPGAKIIFTTYISINYLLSILELTQNKIDIVIFDEAHHLKKDDYIELKRKNFKKLFCTGTAINFMREDPDNLIIQKSIKDAILEKRLCPYVVRIIGLNFGKNNSDSKNEQNDENYLHSAEYISLVTILKILFQDFEIKKLMSFFNKYDMLNKFLDICEQQNLEVKCLYDNRNNSQHNRNKLRLEFNSEKKKVLFLSCKAFLEGVDIPSCDAVLFADSFKSKIRIQQCIGRALRYEEGKTAKILIPLISNINNLEDLTELTKSTQFENMVNILNALAENEKINISDEEKEKILNHLLEEGMGFSGEIGGGSGGGKTEIESMSLQDTLKEHLISKILVRKPNFYNRDIEILKHYNIKSYLDYKNNWQKLNLPEKPGKDDYGLKWKGWDEFLGIINEKNTNELIKIWWSKNKAVHYTKFKFYINNNIITDLYYIIQHDLKISLDIIKNESFRKNLLKILI